MRGGLAASLEHEVALYAGIVLRRLPAEQLREAAGVALAPGARGSRS